MGDGGRTAWPGRLALAAMAGAGAVAGCCMTAVHLAAKRRGALDLSSPEAIEAWAVEHGAPPPVGLAAHLAFGAVTALVLRDFVERDAPPRSPARERRALRIA